MKVIYSLVYFLLLLMLACGSEATTSNTSNNTSTQEIASGEPLEVPPSKDQEPLAGNLEKEEGKELTSNVKAAPINYNTLAEAYCKCAAHTVSVNEKLKTLMDAGDSAGFEAMLPDAEKAFKEAMECCREAKFQQSTAEVEQKKLFPPLKKACPDLPQQLMLKMVTEIK